MKEAIIQNDAVLFGILVLMLGAVFYTSDSKFWFWKKFYNWVPSVLVCYFLPSLLYSFGIIDPSKSNLYFMASRYLLPTSLVLLTISVDVKELMKLGPKAIIMFFTGTAAEVTPIREIDGRVICSGQRGPVTEQLQSTFFDIVQGKNDKYSDWLTVA